MSADAQADQAAPAADKAEKKADKAEARAEKEARREKLAEIKEEGKAKIAAAKDELKAKTAEAKEEMRGEPSPSADTPPAGPERAERARMRRRGEMVRFRALVKRPSEIPPWVREGLRLHARRSALLMRIRALAEEAKDKKTLALCDKLIALEEERHQKRLDHLWRKHGPAGATPAAAAPGDEAKDKDKDKDHGHDEHAKKDKDHKADEAAEAKP